jgi:cellobiose-specific phosphotransferase system component IIB
MIKTFLPIVILFCFAGITSAQLASKWNITDTKGKNLKIEMGKVNDINVPVYILDSKSGDLNIELYYMGTPDFSTKRFLQIMPADAEESNHLLDLTQANERSMSTSISTAKIQEITRSKSMGTIYKVQEVIEGGGKVDMKIIFHFKLK